MPEIDDVDQQQGTQDGDDVQASDAAKQAACDQVPARNPGQYCQWQRYQDGQAQIETKADAQGFPDGIVVEQGIGVETGKAEKEHTPQQGKQRKQNRCCA
ncbi:hypothetical protein D3C85_1668190 [compost metagenome]